MKGSIAQKTHGRELIQVGMVPDVLKFRGNALEEEGEEPV
jgi:hypothetical protein